MKTVAALLSLSSILALCAIAMQNSSASPARITGPDWMYAHV